MIETYLQQIDERLSASPLVSEVQILRRSIGDTFPDHLHDGIENQVVAMHRSMALKF